MGGKEKRMNIKQYNKDRDQAIIELVKTGTLDAWRKVVKKYNLKVPQSETVQKIALYKAAQACVHISDDIKKKAAEECRKFGCDPYALVGGKEDT